MNSSLQKLKNAFVYTSVETLCYQSCLLMYQAYLYYALGAQHYGVIGALFSLIYVGAHYANMGLDITLAPLFNAYKSKYTYLKVVLYHIAPTCIIGLYGILFLVIIPCQTSYATQQELIICCIIALSESIKKTLKTVLHLLLHHYQIAYVEIGYIIAYISSIGILVSCGKKLSFNIIMLPMLLLTWISILIYMYLIYAYWANSIQDDNNADAMHVSTHIMVRVKSYAYQLMRAFYSTNFLVIVIASYYSIEAAGIIKLISSIYTAASSMLRYMLSTTSSVLFCHEKHNSAATQSTLYTLQKYVCMLAVSILCLIGSTLCLTSVTNIHLITQDQIMVCALLITLLILEHASIMYESFLVVQEQMTFLMACYGLSILSVMYAKYSLGGMTTYLYMFIVMMRCMHLAILYWYAYWLLQEPKNNCILGLFWKNNISIKKEHP